MNKILNTFKHFHKINKHRWWVFYYCCKAGIPWRGLIHDFSKYSFAEFAESMKYYDDKRSPIDICKEKNGISMAWMHHKGRNPHHYEYWQDNFDNGGNPICMPNKYAIEMLCDYLGAAKAYMGKEFSYQKEYEWWKKKLEKPLAMHYQQKRFLSIAFCNLKDNPKQNFKKLVQNALIVSKIFPV